MRLTCRALRFPVECINKQLVPKYYGKNTQLGNLPVRGPTLTTAAEGSRTENRKAKLKANFLKQLFAYRHEVAYPLG